MNRRRKIAEPEKQEYLCDDLNPIYIFSITHTELLVKAAKGEIDIKALAIKELKNRGLDINGKWVGFNQK